MEEFDFNTLSDRGINNELVSVLEVVNHWSASENQHSQASSRSKHVKLPLSTPKGLTLVSGNSLFAIQPFCPDLRIRKVDSCEVISDKDLMGYALDLKASELIMPFGKPPACIQVETVVCAYWRDLGDPNFLVMLVSTGVDLKLTQTERQRWTQVSTTLGEMAKKIWSFVPNRPAPTYLVVVRHEQDLISQKYSAKITIIEVDEKRFRVAMGLDELAGSDAKAKEVGAE